MRLRNIPKAAGAIAESPLCISNPKDYKGQWKMSFSQDKPIYIEIGMGKGRFIMDMAKAHPEAFFLGMERYDSVLYRGLQKLEEDPLDNVRFLCEDAGELMEFFAPGELDRIYLNFSDPWPKDRHAKRRLTHHRFLALYKEVLNPAGRLEFKTDNEALFDFSLAEIEESPLFSLTRVTRDLHHDPAMNEGNIMTEYEEKFSSMGNPIFKLVATPNPEEQ